MATSPPILNRGLVSRALPAATTDSTNADVGQRLDRYGGAFLSAPAVGKYPWAEEGSYFVARTPTPGTGVSFTVSASFSDTVPFIFGNNTSATKAVWLDYLKWIVTVVPASATTVQYAVKTDAIPISITTNHVATAVPTCPNLGISATSITNIWYQNNATATAISATGASGIVVAEGAMGGIPIVGDEFVVEFGQPNTSGGSGLTAAQATDPARKVSSAPAVVVPPGGSFRVMLWFASNGITAMSYSFELGLREC